MFEIKELRLLTKEEYKENKEKIQIFHGWWWLQDADTNKYNACCVNKNGNVYNYNIRQPIYVRPALVVYGVNSYHIIGEKYRFFGYKWTLISAENEKGILFCDTYIDERRFDAKSNKWDESELKLWLENWLKDKKEKEREKK